MSASVGIRTPAAVRLGAGLAVVPGAALLTAACSSSGSSSSSAAAASAGGTASPAAAAAGSGLVITTKSGSAGAFLTDGSGRSAYLWAKDGKDSSACSGACFSGDSGSGQVNGQGSDGFGAKWWLVDPAGTSITAAVTVPSGATPSATASSASGGGRY
jgi:hypothetical protein